MDEVIEESHWKTDCVEQLAGIPQRPLPSGVDAYGRIEE